MKITNVVQVFPQGECREVGTSDYPIVAQFNLKMALETGSQIVRIENLGKSVVLFLGNRGNANGRPVILDELVKSIRANAT